MPTRSLGFSPRNRLRELLNDVSLSTNGTPIESPLLLSVSTAIKRRLPRRVHLSLRPLEPVPPPRRIRRSAPSGAGNRDRRPTSAACRNRASPNDDGSPENTEAVEE